MTLESILEQIEDILAATPYTWKEIAAMIEKRQNEKYFAPDNAQKLFALRAAYDYYQTHKIDKGFSYKKYQRQLKKLMKEYAPQNTLHK